MPLKAALSLIFLFVSAGANAANLRGPLPLGLQQMVLGPGCHVMTPSDTSLPCNPAQLPANPKRRFVTNIFVGENFQRVNSYRKDVENKDDLAIVNKLLEEKKPLQMDGAAALWMRNSFFSLAYVPLQMSFYTDVQNQSYPVVDMKFLLEKSLRMQASYEVSWEDWSFRGGLQARGVQRQTIFQKLALFDVLADPKLLKIAEHQSLYLEPGMVTEYKSAWKPRFSIFFQNLRVHHSGEGSPWPLNNGLFDTAVAVSPINSDGWGRWDIGINYRFDKELSEDAGKRLQLLSSYSLGMVTATGAISEGTWSLGAATNFLSAKTGVSLTQTSYPEWNGSTRSDQIVNLEFGLVF